MCFSDLDDRDVLKVSFAASANSLVVAPNGPNGNVGIGEANPSRKLSVAGDINASTLFCSHI